MKTKLVKLSVCDCGFPALKETIPLGTDYEVEPDRKQECVWICGGCKKQRDVTCVWVFRRGASDAGYLPADLFGVSGFNVATHAVNGRNVIELWRDGAFIAAIYETEEGMRVISTHTLTVKAEDGEPHKLEIEVKT